MMLSFWTALPISPYICLDEFRGADWDAHASHAGDRNDVGRRVKNVIQAFEGWVLFQLLTDELVSAFQADSCDIDLAFAEIHAQFGVLEKAM